MEDERFSRITSDAKYRRIPKKEQKVKIDNRFQSMFKDKKFKEEYTVDQRGRPVKYSTTGDLKRYYHQSSSEDTSSSEEEDLDQTKDLKKKDITDKIVSEDTTKKLKNLKVDYARGEQTLFSESSSDDESEDASGEEDEGDVIEHKWGELDAEAESTEEATSRLAACNMDWDRIRAVDIMVLLNSFVPTGGKMESVKIYVSEFGKKRLAEEDVSGPPELRETTLDNDDENEEGAKYHMEKLRQYQLNRLKYYYAVITFDSVKTSSHVYTECDGMEYESSSTKIDLRYIPEDMEFDEEPKEICEKMPDMTKYQPRFFVTTALQQAKVDLTWDETNPERIELTQKINKGKLDEVDQNELENYLALSENESESEEERSINNDDNDNPVEKYKALLLDIEEKEREQQNKDVQMEVTWGLELEKKSEELVKKKLAEKEEKTPFQQYLDKRKEKRKEKKKNRKQSEDNDSDIPSDIDMNDPYFAEEFKNSEFSKKKTKNKKPVDNEEDKEKQAELELLLMNEDSEKRHFSLKKIQDQDANKSKKKKKKSKVEIEKDDFEVNVEDARFSAVFSSHHYNIDPSDSHYKKTQGMERLINEKLKRRATDDNGEITKKSKVDDSKKKKNAELSVLVKSIKRKTQAINKNK